MAIPGDLRSLVQLAHTLAHELPESALDLERGLGRHRFYGAQVADAGVNVLAHIACAASYIPPADVSSRLELRRSLLGARDALDHLRTLLKSLDHHPQPGLPLSLVARMLTLCEQLMALVRALFAEANKAYGLRIG